MIPVPSPDLFILLGLLVLLSLLAASALLLMLLALLFSRSRRHLRRHPKSYIGLSLLLLLLLMPGALIKWQQQRSLADDQAQRQALNPRLEQQLQLGELHFPAGSQVKLDSLEPLDWQAQPQLHGLASLIYAELSQPIEVLGLRVDAIDLPPHHYFSRLRLTANARVDGWPCGAGGWVEFKRDIATRLQPSQWQFRQCQLATQTAVAGVVWPANSQVYANESGWQLSNDDPAEPPLSFLGLALRELRIELDEARQLRRWEGELGAPLDLGDWHYPAGTAVRWQDPHSWLFSPTRDAKANNRHTGEAISAGHSILQRSRDGKTLGVFANDSLGLIDWQAFAAESDAK
ncbi:MAG: hypothetical protein WA173_18300 [Pseudomonas sp.]|uniref:hypothetical protein n=1 Tax=Pseudomonas sp. TaxID=306 RepID=UPI003BB7827A